MNMKHRQTFILSFLVLAINLLLLHDRLIAQHTFLNSSKPATHSELYSDPYKSKLFKVKGIPDLQVNIPRGKIDVVRNSQIDGVKVDLYVKRGFSLWSGTRSLDTYRIIMQQRGDQIIASVEDTRPGRSSDGTDIEFDIVVQVPADVSTNLRSLNGSITLDGVNGKHFIQNQTGNVSVKNTNGDIRVVSTTGNVTLENLAGNIYAKSVSGHIDVLNNEGEVRLRSVSGHIKAENISGTLVSATTSGNVNAGFSDVEVGIYIETISGNINLSLPASTGYAIEGKAMRFNFNELNQGSVTSRSVRSREAKLIIREGELPVNLSSVSGQISVRELNN